MKIDLKKLFWAIGLALVCYSATLSSLIGRFLPGVVRYLLPVVILVVLLLANKLRLKRYLPDYYLPWIAFFLFAVVSVLVHLLNNLLAALVLFLCIALGLLLMRDICWLGVAKKILAWFTGIYVFFTFFFFLFPDTYQIMIDLYGEIPTGTLNGQSGYRAGLADHYSSNGIYISIFLILAVISWMTSTDRTWREKWEKRLWLLVSILSVVALLLTTKRGVLLWSLFALVGTYWIVSRKKLKSFLKLIGACLLGVAGLLFLIERIPELNEVFLRFITIGEDGASLERLAMWELAFNMFRESPIFGTGFWSFPERYADALFGIYNNDLRYKYLAAHNVYFQVLGETGLVGLGIYLTAVGMTFFETLRLVRVYSQNANGALRFAVQFSLCVQIFYLMYSVSGNCLYDNVFYFYGLAMAMTTAVHYYDCRKFSQTRPWKWRRRIVVRRMGRQ